MMIEAQTAAVEIAVAAGHTDWSGRHTGPRGRRGPESGRRLRRRALGEVATAQQLLLTSTAKVCRIMHTVLYLHVYTCMSMYTCILLEQLSCRIAIKESMRIKIKLRSTKYVRSMRVTHHHQSFMLKYMYVRKM